MDEDEYTVCYECGTVFNALDEGDGDVCDECIALAEEEDDALMASTISDETRERIRGRDD